MLPTASTEQPAVMATVLAYLVISAFTVLPYVFWRRRVAARQG